METFPIVKRKDIAAHGAYRTKEAILKVYDAMAAAKSAGVSYQSELTPPPGQGSRHPALLPGVPATPLRPLIAELETKSFPIRQSSRRDVARESTCRWRTETWRPGRPGPARAL
jgi:hypothetical protein